MKAVYVEQPGGVENLKYADIPKPSPGPGQALVKIVASGVNYIDIVFSQGSLSGSSADCVGQRRCGNRGSHWPGSHECRSRRSGGVRDGAWFLC